MRRGVGRRLVEDLVARARERGIGAITVTANPHAMDFYTAVGFVPDGVEQTRFGPATRMRLVCPAQV
jgi:GNAT superfamily N-acetyltransferase